MWPLQQPWFLNGSRGEQAPAEPIDQCCGRRVTERARMSGSTKWRGARTESGRHGRRISAWPGWPGAPRSHTPGNPRTSRALRGARIHQASLRQRQGAPIEVHCRSGTACVSTAFYFAIYIAASPTSSWSDDISGGSAMGTTREPSVSVRLRSSSEGRKGLQSPPASGQARFAHGGQTNAAPSNLGLQRTRFARR